MWSKLQEKGKQLPGGHFKWVKGTRVSKWVNVGENPQLIWLTGSHIMLAQWWQWSAQATAQTTGLLWFKFCSMCKPLEWICSLTKIRTATYAKTYPGAVYTAIEVGIIILQRRPKWQANNPRWLSTHTMWKTSATKRTSPWWVWMGTQPSMLTATWFRYWYFFLRLASRFCKWLAECFAFGKVTL